VTHSQAAAFCHAELCHVVLCCAVRQPIIHYFSLATGADPIPFLTAEFTAANIWSMLLFVGGWPAAAADALS
jgi:Na+/H+ antiporter NhaD/arsenite permease-like protein